MKIYFVFFLSFLCLVSCKKYDNIGDFYPEDSSYVWLNSAYKNVKYYNADSSLRIDTSNIYQQLSPDTAYNRFDLDCSGNVCRQYNSHYKKIIYGISGYTFNYTLSARTDGINKWDALIILVQKMGQPVIAGASPPMSGFRFMVYSDNSSFHWEEEAPFQYYDSLLLGGVLRKNVYHIFANYNSEFYLSKEEGIVAFKFRDEEFFYKH